MADEKDRERAALETLGWDCYVVSRTRVARSPDRKVFILSDRCTSRDIVEIVSQWRQGAEAES